MFKNGSLVKISRTSDPILDGHHGIIKGIAMQSVYGIGSIYIVELPESIKSIINSTYSYDCIVLFEHCLELI